VTGGYQTPFLIPAGGPSLGSIMASPQISRGHPEPPDAVSLHGSLLLLTTTIVEIRRQSRPATSPLHTS